MADESAAKEEKKSPGTPTGVIGPMVPMGAEELVKSSFVNMLAIGPAKVGKTTAILGSCPKPAYVLNSDQGDSLEPAYAVTRDFKYNVIHSMDHMESGIKLARKLVKSEGVKTIVWDTITGFSDYLLDEVIILSGKQSASGKPDGRKYWNEYKKYLMNTCRRLIAIPAHVVVISHYLDPKTESSDDDGGKKIPKVGEGILPGLAGAARLEVPRLFNNIVFIEKRKSDDERVFLTDTDGVFTAGCRNLKGVKEMPADVGLFIKKSNERWQSLKKNGVEKPNGKK
jgi:hypothetical protein